MISYEFLNNFDIINKNKDDFYFQYNNNLLTLNAGSLPCVSNRQYEIFVSTIYMNVQYYQNVIIDIVNSTQPVALIE